MNLNRIKHHQNGLNMEENDNGEIRLPEPDLENAVDVEFRAENHSSEMLSKMNDLRTTHSDTQEG